MTEKDDTGFSINIETALRSRKVDHFLLIMYHLESEKNGYDPSSHEVAIIVEIANSFVELAGAVSRSDRFVALKTDFSSLPAIIDMPEVLRIDWCDDSIMQLLLDAHESSDVVMTNPTSEGLSSDDWDSAEYNHFWEPIESNFREKVDLLKKLGKTVTIN